MTDVIIRVWLQRGQRRRSGKTSGGCSLPQGGSTGGGSAWESCRLRWRFQGTLLWTAAIGRFTNLLDSLLRPYKTPRAKASLDLFG